MDSEPAPRMIPRDDPAAVALVLAVHGGDLDIIEMLLAEHPGLVRARFVAQDGGTGTSLHMAADWPGYFPNGPEVVKLLISAGADPNVPTTGRGGFAETPLHWAASSDDGQIAAALIDGGADIEVPGGSIAGGTPLANAVGYGCWHVARLLVARGAHIGSLWEAAALGDRPRVDELFAADPPPTAADIDEAFWQACHGGQRRMAEYLLARGANINATPGYSNSTPLQVATQPDTQRQALADWLRQVGATGA
jgi:ankyrin repeat protein